MPGSQTLSVQSLDPGHQIRLTRRTMHTVLAPSSGIPNMGLLVANLDPSPEIRRPHEFRTCGRYTPLTLCV